MLVCCDAIALEYHTKLCQATNYSDHTNKGKDTDKILSLVNEKFLSGEGFRKNKD
ncbi:hypothetical protein [Nostoc sp.]|uniref:hypothetical protein n=1 Tax=Nostoc sp. TaxID=1180 RepID=UPI002FFA1C18